METPVMLKHTSPSPGLFVDQALNCPTTRCISTWMWVLPHNLDLSKAEFLTSLTPTLLRLQLSHVSVKVPFMFLVSGQRLKPFFTPFFYIWSISISHPCDFWNTRVSRTESLSPTYASASCLSPALQTDLLSTLSLPHLDSVPSTGPDAILSNLS